MVAVRPLGMKAIYSRPPSPSPSPSSSSSPHRHADCGVAIVLCRSVMRDGVTRTTPEQHVADHYVSLFSLPLSDHARATLLIHTRSQGWRRRSGPGLPRCWVTLWSRGQTTKRTADNRRRGRTALLYHQHPCSRPLTYFIFSTKPSLHVRAFPETFPEELWAARAVDSTRATQKHAQIDRQSTKNYISLSRDGVTAWRCTIPIRRCSMLLRHEDLPLGPVPA